MTDPTAAWYQRFGEMEARGQSAVYEQWALGVASDEELLGHIRSLPRPKRQPNLIFAVSRLLGAPEGGYARWRAWLLEHWDAVADAAAARSTQTNEPRRCAALLPALALVPGPVAVVELGAAAGLCLFPDRYSYIYEPVPEAPGAGAQPAMRLDPAQGPSPVVLECVLDGPAPIPREMPRIVWRAGVDLNPLDVRDESDMLWLRTLVWPEQFERRRRIDAAIELARSEPPLLVRGDALDELERLLERAPAEASIIVVSSGALVYVERERRRVLVDRIARLGAHFVSLEAQGVVPGLQPEGTQPGTEFALGLDGNLLGFAGPHGQRLAWRRPAR